MQRQVREREADGATSPPPASPADPARPVLSSQPLKAIGLICIAVICFSFTDTAGKYLITVKNIPLAEVVWVRFLGQLAAIVLALGLFALPSLFRARKPGLQLIRSCLLLASTAFNFIALRTLRLDQSMTIQFLTPLTVALLAGPLLGEWVGWRRMLAILVGFGGVVIAVHPGADGIEFAFVWSFLCMLAYALFTLMTRHLASHDGVAVTLFYSVLAGAVLVAPFALAEWVWPAEFLTQVVMASFGAGAAAGHALFIAAFRFAPASTLAPFTYFSLLSHLTAGYLVFGQTPDQATLAGAAVIVASGLYLLHRERIRHKTPSAIA